jgi:gliding motility-associated lipoprotein GldD
MNKILLIFTLLAACSTDYAPKPEGQMHIKLPSLDYYEHRSHCNYVFEKNQNASNSWADSSLCWENLYYPDLRSIIQMTYKPINNNLDTLLRDASELAYKHVVKAAGITDQVFINEEEKVYGVLFELMGETATQTQFFVTDSTHHFLRGVVYTQAPPNEDSLKPVHDFLKNEVRHLMETLKWSHE